MKTRTLFIAILVLFSMGLSAQKKGTSVEVLYFKAQLACCQARSCSVLESDVQKVVETHFKDKNVKFKEVKLRDPESAELVKAHNARSQTVVLVATRKKKSQSVDITDLVAQYNRNKDFATFEKELCAKISALL
jgi:hypothetical protein